jgi:hypothetical protein
MSNQSFRCEFLIIRSNSSIYDGFAHKLTKSHLNGSELSRNTDGVPQSGTGCGTGWVVDAITEVRR